MWQEALKADFKEVLSTSAGRRVFGSIFDDLEIDEETFSTNELSMAWRSGMRSAGLRVTKRVRDADPRLVAECCIEYQDFARSFYDKEEEDDNDE
jgi:hypothetical protein